MRKGDAMKKFALAACLVLLALPEAATAGDYDEASLAASILAAADTCKITIGEAQKKSLYASLLSVWKSPSQVQYEIGRERDALKSLSASDRATMCQAIGDAAATSH
jgi:hypothetical protein